MGAPRNSRHPTSSVTWGRPVTELSVDVPQEVCTLRNGKDQSAELEPCQGCGLGAVGALLGEVP